ncbi:MAG: hypothetical protein M1825_000774 [Sarcosagium campestre]|nr:MAG: hypothetical protein M1825_000774 [Sarcosagium campestre]
MDQPIPQYNNTHRAFLQAFISRGTLTLEQAKPILAAILTAHDGRETLPGDVTEADFNTYVHAISDEISSFDLAIRSTLSQHDRCRIFALVNTTSDPITQLATTHSADEISFLKRLLDAMFETHNTPRQEVMAISSMQAVRLHKNPAGSTGDTPSGGAGTSAGHGLSMTGAERTLEELVREGWLERSRRDFYSLSPRALVELRQYLLTTYNDPAEDDDDSDAEQRYDRIKFCVACKDIITVVSACFPFSLRCATLLILSKGQRCATRDCPCRLHNICTESFFRTQPSRTCPLCKVDWTGNDFVGEKAVTSAERAERRSGGAQRRRTIPAATQQVDADGEYGARA